MPNLKIAAVSLLLLIFVSHLFGLVSFGTDEEKAALSTTVGAEEVLASAYEEVLEADEAGADVSDLLDRLNFAAEHLALAKICFRREDFDSTADHARLCIEAADGIVEDVEVLKDRAARENVEYSWMKIGGSTVGVVVAVFVSLFGWKAFKQHHYRRVLKMKPEVREAES